VKRRRWPLLVATLPLWPIAWLLLSASAARLTLGYWPSYNRPDPKDVSPLILDVPVLPLLLLSPLAVVTSVIIAFRDWYCGRTAWSGVAFAAVGSFLVLVVWLRLDRGGFFEWWFD
jgi:hypothetical protein